MHTALDTTADVTSYLSFLKAEGVKGISRYIASGGSYKLTHRPEIDHIHDADMDVYLNFEGRGNRIDAFSAAMGKLDATMSFDCARNELGAPKGTCIFFSCEPETIYGSYNISLVYPQRILPYYKACRDVFGDYYRVGVYSFGTWMRRLKQDKAADLFWLPGAPGWDGYTLFKASGDWAFRQMTPGEHGLEQNFHGLQVDWDEINPAFADTGAWSRDPNSQPVPVPTQLPPTIRLGSRGEDVKKLQTLLGITSDGVFGPITYGAVRAYQGANGLTPDGIVGNMTWRKILPVTTL